MPVTVLKRKHSLKGKNLFPSLKKVKETRSVDGGLARLATQQRTEDMDSADLKGAFRELTGERAEEFLEMAGKPENEPSLRMLLHFTILEANKSGQTGQTLATSETTTTTATTECSQTDEEEDRPSSSKKRKSSDDLEKRITMLEEGQDSVESLKEKVRMLCLQANPNDALILLALDDLARAARKKQHSEMDTYEELVRQAHKHQHAVNIASLALGVVGGKAVDVVVKVLNKCVKEKQVESKLNSNSQETEAKKNENLNYNSPMFNAYPNYPMPPMPMWQTPGYGMQSQSYYYPRSRGRGFRPKGNCYFCEMPGHTIKECQKMKMAKAQK